jgi:hypothetical protein
VERVLRRSVSSVWSLLGSRMRASYFPTKLPLARGKESPYSKGQISFLPVDRKAAKGHPRGNLSIIEKIDDRKVVSATNVLVLKSLTRTSTRKDLQTK